MTKYVCRPGQALWIGLSIILSIGTLKLCSQNAESTLTGQVSDSSGGLVTAADVAVVNADTGVRREAQSNDSGLYSVPLLQPGNYRISVRKHGFRPLTRSGVVLRTQESLRVDFVLEVGSPTETVEVNADVPHVNTENASLGSRVSRQEVTELPISFTGGRQIQDFLLLGAGMTSQAGLYQDSNYSVNGSPLNTQYVVVDGVKINSPGSDIFYRLRPAVGEVEEIKVQSGSYGADSSGIGAINISTQPGTNRFHGEGFFFYGDDSLRARNFFEKTKPPYRNREVGGTLGGPIVKNHTFFALSYDRFDTSQPRAGTGNTVPTDTLRNGNFQGVATIYDPNSTRQGPDGKYIRDPFSGNQIPVNRIDPVAAKLLAYLPEPNIPGLVVNNFNSRLIPDSNFNQILPNFSARVDQAISSRNQLFGRFQHFWGGYAAEQTYSGLADLTGQTVETPGSVVTLGDTHTFRPNLINEFRFGYTNISNSYRNKAYNQDIASQVGLNNVSALTFPQITVAGVIPFQFGPRSTDNQGQSASTEFNETVSWLYGRQSIKFGGSFRHERNYSYSIGAPSGNFAFTGIFSNLPSTSSAGAGLADFLLGLPSTTSVSAGVPFDYRRNGFAFFVQDDIKLTSRLSMNIGLRYEAFLGVTEQQNRMSSFDPSLTNPVTNTPGALYFAGLNGPRNLADPDWNNVSPRLGFAYSLTPKTVVRAGYAINYYANPINWQVGSSIGFAPSQILQTTDQVTPLVRLQAGPPALAPVPAPNPGIGNGNAVVYVPRYSPSVTYQQFTFSIQRELPFKLFVETAYVNGHGSHLWFPRDVNQVPQALLGPGNAQSRRPFPQFNSITSQATDGYSNYNALQITVTRRLTSGLTFSAYYTYSKSLDDTSKDSNFVGSAPIQNSYNAQAEYGLSDHDTPHIFNMTATYEIPRWLPQSKFANIVARGWQLNGVAHAQTGFPFNLTVASNQSGALAGTIRPNRVGNGTLPDSQQSITHWFDTSAFQLPLPYTFGSAGRNILRGPGFTQLDFSVAKNSYFHTILNERTNLQLRVEFYNLFNHPNFGNPNGTIGSPTAGIITSAKDPRAITLATRFVF